MTIEDALAMGARLKAEAKARSEERIAFAISAGGPTTAAIGHKQRYELASLLYEARWDNKGTLEEVTDREVLDGFCLRVWGARYEEVLKAWDRELEAGL